MGGSQKEAKAIIDFTKQAEKDLRKLQKKLSLFAIDDLHKKLESISNDPFSDKPLSGNLRDFYCIRFGSYIDECRAFSFLYTFLILMIIEFNAFSEFSFSFIIFVIFKK
ncbi:TPA: type II toxin-antitoxin system RelE/ParE family toxin [Candidatus Poribacteria bacterium]|nr:type II toxin-antitoxin system RelE/ParE family toxin [Candidatus Poribacteria bacterium]